MSWKVEIKKKNSYWSAIKELYVIVSLDMGLFENFIFKFYTCRIKQCSYVLSHRKQLTILMILTM